jgi:chromosome segregation ATPase|tara:strand:- start:975 stop:1448 length:474 start_codon:yes stop_codon:yes gene_type:complete
VAISQLEQAMATLRLGIAEMRAKEERLDAQINQFRTQLRRLPRQVVYGQTSLELSLTAMGEIEERLEDAVANRRRLLAIKDTAIQELEALQLLKRVDEARSKLASLKKNGLFGASSGEEAQEQIRQLEGFIAANSRQAEQAITDRFRQRMDGDLTAI